MVFHLWGSIPRLQGVLARPGTPTDPKPQKIAPNGAPSHHIIWYARHGRADGGGPGALGP